MHVGLVQPESGEIIPQIYKWGIDAPIHRLRRLCERHRPQWCCMNALHVYAWRVKIRKGMESRI